MTESAAVILLHGLGADGQDLLPLSEELGLPDGVRWLAPDAPVRPVTANGGMDMRAWFDILGFDASAPVDTRGIAQSVAGVHQMIEQLCQQGVKAERIFLLGFSQGGVVALHAALSHARRLGGVIGLSTWLPAVDLLLPLPPVQQSLPVFLAHGQLDGVVPITAALRARDRLAELGVSQVSWHEYAMAHSICCEELEAVSAWLTACLAD